MLYTGHTSLLGPSDNPVRAPRGTGNRTESTQDSLDSGAAVGLCREAKACSSLAAWFLLVALAAVTFVWFAAGPLLAQPSPASPSPTAPQILDKEEVAGAIRDYLKTLPN